MLINTKKEAVSLRPLYPNIHYLQAIFLLVAHYAEVLHSLLALHFFAVPAGCVLLFVEQVRFFPRAEQVDCALLLEQVGFAAFFAEPAYYVQLLVLVAYVALVVFSVPAVHCCAQFA